MLLSYLLSSGYSWPLACAAWRNQSGANDHFTIIIFYVGLYMLIAEFKVFDLHFYSLQMELTGS